MEFIPLIYIGLFINLYVKTHLSTLLDWEIKYDSCLFYNWASMTQEVTRSCELRRNKMKQTNVRKTKEALLGKAS